MSKESLSDSSLEYIFLGATILIYVQVLFTESLV